WSGRIPRPAIPWLEAGLSGWTAASPRAEVEANLHRQSEVLWSGFGKIARPRPQFFPGLRGNCEAPNPAQPRNARLRSGRAVTPFAPPRSGRAATLFVPMATIDRKPLHPAAGHN